MLTKSITNHGGEQRAKANGVKLGRPSKMNDGMKSAVKLLREKGMGVIPPYLTVV